MFRSNTNTKQQTMWMQPMIDVGIVVVCALVLTTTILTGSSNSSTTMVVNSFSLTSLTMTAPIYSKRHRKTSYHSILSAKMKEEEESEWYCPPTIQTKATNVGITTTNRAVTTVPQGQMALQINTLRTESELYDFLNNGDERLTILKFYASYCKSCTKLTHQLKNYCQQYADWIMITTAPTSSSSSSSSFKDMVVTRKGSVRIVNIEYNPTTKEMCTKYNIHRLPTIQMYIQGTKVQDFVCPPSQMFRLIELTEYYTQRQQQSFDGKNNSDIQFESTLDMGHAIISNKLQKEKETKRIATKPTPSTVVQKDMPSNQLN